MQERARESSEESAPDREPSNTGVHDHILFIAATMRPVLSFASTMSTLSSPALAKKLFTASRSPAQWRERERVIF